MMTMINYEDNDEDDDDDDGDHLPLVGLIWRCKLPLRFHQLPQGSVII